MSDYLNEGGVRLHHGDSLDVLPTLNAHSVDLVVTDPPYVIGAVSAGNMASKSGGWGDMMNSAHWFSAWYTMVRRVLKPTGAMWTFCNWRSLPVIMRAASDAQWPVASVLVWDKEAIGPGGPVGLRPRYELVALLPMSEFAIPNRGIPDIRASRWSTAKPSGHPAEKPVDLLRWLIEISGIPPGGVVLDPFAGSGASMLAAIESGCEWVGIEQEERWCRLIASRPRQGSLLPFLGGEAA